ncbi:MAG: glycosyltransferase family 2 protein [bacterium]
MFEGKTVSVVIPAFNEADVIAETVAAVRALGTADEVVVVDDGSADATGGEALRAGARVISLERNRGKGAALNEGVAAVRGEIIVFVDADTGTSASEVVKLIEPAARGECDMAIGAFASRGGFGFVLKLSRWGVRRACGFAAGAPLSGQRAFTRGVLRSIHPFRRDFGVETDMLIRAVRGGWRVIEVPVEMRHRSTARDVRGFAHRGRQGWGVARALCRAFIRRR